MKSEIKLIQPKILLVAMQYGWGDSKNGFSYEWNHVYLGLKNRFESLCFFDFLSAFQKEGQKKMQDLLLEKIKNTCPDIIIFMPFTDEFTTDFVTSLKQYSKTFCFFMDDTWRIDYVKRWAPYFDAFSTVDPFGQQHYEKNNFSHSVFLPDGVNTQLFNRLDLKRDIDVSFVGSWHPYREWVIQQLKKSGINVSVYGLRWSNGIVTTEKMIEIFNRSKISLNLSNSVSWDARYFLSHKRAIINTIRSPKTGEQIKGRHFEIPACGALQISFYTTGLGLIYDIDKELVIYNDPYHLATLIQFYLNEKTEREKIADAGYQRTISEHDYADRFYSVFKQLGWCV
ncbi:MAG: hypothetical protein COY58_01205 [Gammaproteobacteria bacterium CG_4_10_14_0_8_um_filter_38_16]|nr:MAG: hypothetical protein COY58_01205 [Gammaproteobacteria bacterium CG_4_10_14_0_8_um_filter_38_16]PJA03262.1 MAG: hypothetical protein COX72_06205 [Gammaproteobacteria bacterium CG_4_10_14_0_2_um_filter_38_22]PJB09836.1 MAG: hypothetical protein CO120_08000 [Gammaproteobacteria bacterium CG_4_9_14_3_um_filter_38_9]